MVSPKAGMPTTAVAPDMVGKPVTAGMSLTTTGTSCNIGRRATTIGMPTRAGASATVWIPPTEAEQE